MAWDPTTNPAITHTRLRLSSPEYVYQALEEYGAYLRDQPCPVAQGDSLEKMLAGRNDRLIDLALAKNAASRSLVVQLYKRALTGSGDTDYDRAVRLACLSNRIAVDMLDSEELRGSEALTDSELYRLAMEGDDGELATLLRNPDSRDLVRAVYGRETPFHDISDERWWTLVHCSIGNRALNRDDGDELGPDLWAWNLHKALFRLLCTAPAEPGWVWILHMLLVGVNPARTRSADSEKEVIDALERWKCLTPDPFGNGEEEGRFTSLSLAEEFRCLIAAHYGRVFIQNQSTCVGRYDAEDVALRCAYYGCTEMMVFEMKVAHDKDGDIFTFAALFNDSLLLKKDCRAKLEGYVTGDMQRLYSARCAQLQTQYR